MNIILLSGGSGKRLWPLSNDIRSKQFIKIFKKEDGTYESMVQRVYRQIRKVDTDATVTIATSKTQVSAIHNQLGEDVGISVEPCRRDTFPAIALATAYLVDVMHVAPSESVVVCPVDPYVEDGYFEALKELSEQADKCEANLVLMGIEPTYPSEKYGYIIPESTDHVAEVRTFREKPTADVAEQYIAQGALWNGGVFAYKMWYAFYRDLAFGTGGLRGVIGAGTNRMNIYTVAKSDVLKFLLEDNCSLVVRPSGTEPKLKIYISVSAENKEMAEEVEDEIAKTAEKWIC